MWWYMLKVFRSHAGWFVAVSWLLLLVTIPICIGIAVAGSIGAFYFPTHRMAPFDNYDNTAAGFAVAAGAVAALASSIALALNFRTTASAFLVTIWSVILIYRLRPSMCQWFNAW